MKNKNPDPPSDPEKKKPETQVKTDSKNEITNRPKPSDNGGIAYSSKNNDKDVEKREKNDD